MSRFWSVFLIVVFLFLVAVPVMAQDVPGGDVPPDVDPRFLALFVAIAAVNRFVDVVKPSVRKFKISEEAQDVVLKVFAVLIGVMATVASNGALNLFTDIPRITPLFGAILTGALIGLGSEVVHGFIDLLYGWRARPALLAQTKFHQLKAGELTGGKPLDVDSGKLASIFDNKN